MTYDRHPPHSKHEHDHAHTRTLPLVPLPVLHWHNRTAQCAYSLGLVVVECDPTITVAKFCLVVWQVPWKKVGVEVQAQVLRQAKGRHGRHRRGVV